MGLALVWVTGKGFKMERLAMEKVTDCAGNVFYDLGLPNPAILVTKSILALHIIQHLDDHKTSVKRASKITGIGSAKISKIRNGDLAAVTLDQLCIIIDRLSKPKQITLCISKEAPTVKFTY